MDNDTEFDDAFAEALDFCDGDEDMAVHLASAHLDSGNTYMEDTFAAIGDLLAEGFCH